MWRRRKWWELQRGWILTQVAESYPSSRFPLDGPRPLAAEKLFQSRTGRQKGAHGWLFYGTGGHTGVERSSGNSQWPAHCLLTDRESCHPSRGINPSRCRWALHAVVSRLKLLTGEMCPLIGRVSHHAWNAFVNTDDRVRTCVSRLCLYLQIFAFRWPSFYICKNQC